MVSLRKRFSETISKLVSCANMMNFDFSLLDQVSNKVNVNGDMLHTIVCDILDYE